MVKIGSVDPLKLGGPLTLHIQMKAILSTTSKRNA